MCSPAFAGDSTNRPDVQAEPIPLAIDAPELTLTGGGGGKNKRPHLAAWLNFFLPGPVTKGRPTGCRWAYSIDYGNPGRLVSDRVLAAALERSHQSRPLQRALGDALRAWRWRHLSRGGQGQLIGAPGQRHAPGDAGCRRDGGAHSGGCPYGQRWRGHPTGLDSLPGDTS